ncbi:hypothetical protein EPI10_027173 [Gossypium australe]|uniref:Uncharacterized protein n=1 Tax=Gossypium australe TaxID=47621 RepID=A0A5B6UUX4_9ROSI|nr:hypothetical protein EPI10_027173 [Gossypium australe]
MPIALADFSLSLKSRNCYPHQSHSRMLLRVQARVPSNSSVRPKTNKVADFKGEEYKFSGFDYSQFDNKRKEGRLSSPHGVQVTISNGPGSVEA